MTMPRIKTVDLSELDSIESLLKLISEEDDIILQNHGVKVGVLFPNRTPRPLLVPAKSEEDLQRARDAAGGWAGLGMDDLVEEIYRDRERSIELDEERWRWLFPETEE